MQMCVVNVRVSEKESLILECGRFDWLKLYFIFTSQTNLYNNDKRVQLEKNVDIQMNQL